MTPERIDEVATVVIDKHREKPRENPLGYMVVLARQGVRPAATTSTVGVNGWEPYVTPTEPLKPLAGLLTAFTDAKAKAKKGKKRPVQQLDEECDTCDGAARVKVDGEWQPCGQCTCTICGGAGAILTRRLRWMPGRIEPQVIAPCPRCTAEPEEDRCGRLLEASGIEGAMLDMTTETLRKVKGVENAIVESQRFLAGEIQQLVFLGAPGRGKTHAAVAVLRACIERGEPGLYLNVTRFLDALRMTYDAGSEETYRSLMIPALEWPVCVLDDVAGEYKTEWTREKLYEVVDSRYQKGLRTVACSNHDPGSWDERVLSRLCDRRRGAIVKLTGEDYRLKGAR